MRYILGLLILLLAGTANAQEVGTGLICNTREQVERFIMLFNSGSSIASALGVINVKNTECGILTVVYERSEKQGKPLRTKDGTMQITTIVVHAISSDSKNFIQTPPLIQFTMFKVQGEEV